MDPHGKEISDLRQHYDGFVLRREMLLEDPFRQFAKWFDEAIKNPDIQEPNAMALATADSLGQPRVRTVLLKSYDHSGFAFYTNYDSRKGQEIEANPKVSLLFFWESMMRQIRIDGTIGKLSEEEADAYFSSRPRDSRIGAHVSRQSSVIPGRDILDQRFEELSQQFGEDAEIPRPENWGGYLIKPDLFEFWQGRPSRLHDRFEYTRFGEEWKIERLSP